MELESTSFGDLLLRYGREVSVKKRGHRAESVRIEWIWRDELAEVSVAHLTTKDFADWRDRHLGEVKNSTLRR